MSNLSNRHPRRAVRFAPRFEALEDRSVPAAGFPGISAGAVAIAPEDGGIPRIKIVNPATGEDVAEIQAYEDAFRGGVNVALGDVTGDGVRDLIIAPGAGGGPRIRIVDGKTGDTLNDFFVYESTFTGGINVAVGDVDGDGIGDIQELRDGTDPNSAGDASGPEYGCIGNVAPVRSVWPGAAVVLAALALIAVRRRPAASP